MSAPAPAAADPVGAEEFAALMAPLGPFSGDRRIGVAVSGGADSMALALLLHVWGRPFACVVDHGLRPESAAEAALTVGRLGVLGVPARLLRADLRHGPALAARARAARYGLLVLCCREAGLADLALGHHMRDQAETLLLREAGASGANGLAGMAAVAHTESVRLLRPLLAIAPARLRATLCAAGVAWAEDPSNTDPATPRARLRAGRLARHDAVEALAGKAALHGAARATAEARAADELAANVSIHPTGVAHIRAPVGAEAVSALVWCLSGGAYPPPGAGAAHLSDCLHASRTHGGTLHGVRVLPAGRVGPGWLAGREAAAMQGDVPMGECWDGRFHAASAGSAAVPDPAAALTLGPLGADAARLRRWSTLPAALLQTLPTLRRDGAIVAVPHLGYLDAAACCGVRVLFRPARPAAPAAFVAA